MAHARSDAGALSAGTRLHTDGWPAREALRLSTYMSLSARFATEVSWVGRREQKEIAVIGNALMVSVDWLQAVAEDVRSGLNGLIADVNDRRIKMNGAEDFAVDELAIRDAQSRVRLRGGGNCTAQPDFTIGAAGSRDIERAGREQRAHGRGEFRGRGRVARGDFVILGKEWIGETQNR